MRKFLRKPAILLISSSFLTVFVAFSDRRIMSVGTTYSSNNKLSEFAVPVAYIYGKEPLYTTIEKALEEAVSGDIVFTIPPTDSNYHDADNKIIPNKVTYTISRDCEIKSGVSLVIPTDKTSISNITDSSTLKTYITSLKTDDRKKASSSSLYGTYATTKENYFLRTTIEVADGVTITNYGSLIVSGYLSGGTSGVGMVGQTAFSYTRILLGDDSKIIQKSSNAYTYCFGYISEKNKDQGSSIEINQGFLYVPFIVNDYRGFNVSWAMTDGAIDEERCSPFNQFELRNIDSEVTVDYGANVITSSNFYVSYSTMGVSQNFQNDLNLVGNSSSYFLQMNNSDYSKIVYKYDKATSIGDLDIYGGAILNNFSLKLSTTGLTVNLDTTEAFFPISYRLDVELKKDDNQTQAIYDLTKQRVKILPGSSFIISSGVSVNSNDLVVYSAFYDGKIGDGLSSKNSYTGVSYPLKNGAKFIVEDGGLLNSTSLGGVIYGSLENISYETSSVVSKEARNYKSSGSLSPAWTIDDYLVLSEQLQIKDVEYLSDKKLYIGVNKFQNYLDYSPSFSILSNNETIINNISGDQNVLFYDSLADYKIDFIQNIYKAYSASTLYTKNSVVSIDDSSAILGVVNSTISILNDNNGVNEFNVQSIDVSCVTPLVDGNIPLYVGSTIKLEADINDIDKSYDKEVSRYSSDDTVATVDDEGNVTGVSLGAVTIYVECDGVVGNFNTEVINNAEIIEIESISIEDGDGNSSTKSAGTSTFGGETDISYNGKYGNNVTIKFTVNIDPNEAQYSSITWTLNASATGRQYINDKTQNTNYAYNVTQINVYTVSDTGTSDDKATLTCSVTSLSGNSYSATFVINHKADTCILPNTLILMANGTLRNAEDVKIGDYVLAFNHEKGLFEETQVIMNDHIDKIAEVYDVMKLTFSDDSFIEIVSIHGFFDVDLNKYVYINDENYKEFIGHKFYKIKDRLNLNLEVVELVDIKKYTKFTKVYGLGTKKHLNLITNDLLTMEGGLTGLFNIFEYEKGTLKFDKKAMKRDIEKYGLLSYDDFKHLFPYEIYELLPCEFLGVSIGKGYINWEIIEQYVEKWGKELMKNIK
jgi:FKBP-type peptidyl-prolyl cis-trans isomerase 2